MMSFLFLNLFILSANRYDQLLRPSDMTVSKAEEILVLLLFPF